MEWFNLCEKCGHMTVASEKLCAVCATEKRFDEEVLNDHLPTRTSGSCRSA